MLRSSRHLWPLAAVVGVLLAAIVGIGLAGGWAEADGARERDLPEVAAGEGIDLGPVRLSLHSWGVVPLEDYRGEEPRVVATLAIRATITTTSTESMNLPTHLVHLADVAEDGWLSAVRVGDLSRFSSLTPGVTEEVILTLPVADPAELEALGDDDLELLPTAYEHAAHTLSGELGWWERDPIAVVAVPRDQSAFAAYVAALAERNA